MSAPKVRTNSFDTRFTGTQAETSICFGYSTALEILRSVDISKLSFARGGNLSVPDKPPRKRFLLDAINWIETICPSLTIKSPAHVLIKDPVGYHSLDKCKSHLCQTKFVYGSLYRLTPSIFVSSAALTFVHMAAREKDFMTLLQLGYEICGTYQTIRTSARTAYQVPPLTSIKELRNFIERNPSFYGVQKARKALRYIADGSASARETKLALLLGLPMSYGGYGLGIPRMNYEIETNSAAREIAGRNHLRCDLCWPQAKLDVEYQSREMHEGETHRIKDSRRTNALTAMGWTCINITNDELDSLHTMNVIADSIRKHIGKRERIVVSNYHARKFKLRMQLGLFVGNE